MPVAHLKQQQPEIDDNPQLVQPSILDNVSGALVAWSGYSVLAQPQNDPSEGIRKRLSVSGSAACAVAKPGQRHWARLFGAQAASRGAEPAGSRQ